jgi:hypothetical protein
MVDGDQHSIASRGGSHIGDQSCVRVKPSIVGLVVQEIALVENDSGRLQLGEQCPIP